MKHTKFSFLRTTAKAAFATMASLLLSQCTTSPKPLASSQDPAKAAQHFYDQLRLHKVDGLPRDQGWKAVRPLVTPGLAINIKDAQRQQAVFLKHNPDEKAPWIEGDLFSSLFEGPQTHRIGRVSIAGDRAEVTVHFTRKEGSQTTQWTDLLILQKTSQGWLVEDVQYRGTWQFAPKGSLVEVLTSEGC